MTRSDQERLVDIVESCAETAYLVAEGRQRFDADRTVQLALERLLEIIGEAANALTPATRDQHPEIEWRDITRLRIVPAHHYHRVDPDQAWSIASTDVPRLAEALGSNG